MGGCGKAGRWLQAASAGLSRGLYRGSLHAVTPYLEELNLIKVWERPDAAAYDRECFWEIEARPLLSMVSELYENTEIEDTEIDEGMDLETMMCFVYRAYAEKLAVAGQKGLSELFGHIDVQDWEQTVDLEVAVRRTDCVRVIRMNLGDSLYNLHRMIQRAVDFGDDHLYEFHIGRGMLEKIYAPVEAVTSGRELPLEGTKLGELELHKGQVFTYLFDFGDSWWFDIKVLEIREGTVETPRVIKAVNDAPQQYPFFE